MMRNTKFGTLFFLSLLVSVVFLVPGLAQGTEKWTGTWKMNPAHSSFGDGGGPKSITIQFELKGNSLAETLTVDEQNFNLKYATDGTTSLQDVMVKDTKTTARWEGETLIIEFSAEGRSFLRKISLSPDGKTMTVAVQHRSDHETRNETIVLEKI